jgi:Xaa-Pro aminopeptidase
MLPTFFPRAKAYNNVLIPVKYSYSGGASYAIYEEITAHHKYELVPSPVLFRKAAKNEIEIDNIKRCQIRDSATLIEFLEELESEVGIRLKGSRQ